MPEWLLPWKLPPHRVKGTIKHCLERDPRSIFMERINIRRRLHKDTAYVNRLKGLDQKTRCALLNGDWDIEGSEIARPDTIA